MIDANITFIGGGNMARSLIGGLLADGTDPQRIRVADPDPGRREGLTAQGPVRVFADNAAAAADADAVVFAVKPQVLRAAASQLAPVVHRERPLVISIAAGIRSADLDRWLGGDAVVVRAMPNTPALVRSGATALYANSAVSAVRRDLAESILRAVGITLWVADEAMMDAVTALSGSGPAYFFLVMEALEAAGVELGLTPETARLLTLETAIGTARIAMESDEGVGRLRRRVTSPGGTTEAALAVLEQAGLHEQFRRALRAARDRSCALADEFGAS
ncbi:pyrroline-5-carboxylate reductase [bacterium BMS3Bbin12]|nr:pyrroline-5-carboxylate reductase [bacterium BMS3Abin12]GBE46930.1 pyrroline-5-carboxylate reductase [bacterium BMS3Bbin12]GBE50601.1 pyrroline-5-carboxylate reductase [bacterium BMS3Bbin13]HDJ86820.1 pyrroline-5-carboxylate reductase [Chromatiales bacterium]HDK03732.1 pyrroline-5-carboxylate reductase [Gammaproteobacteria bacterium]